MNIIEVIFLELALSLYPRSKSHHLRQKLPVTKAGKGPSWTASFFAKINYLTSSDSHPDTLFRHSFWHIIWMCIWHMYSDIWESFWHLFRHSFLHSIRHLFWQSFWDSIWPSLWHEFGSRRTPQHHGSDPFMSTVPPRRQRTEAEEEVEEEEGEGEESEEGGEEGEQGVTHLLKSRDPYLASGKTNQIQQWQPAKHHNIKPSIYHIPIEKYQRSTIKWY